MGAVPGPAPVMRRVRSRWPVWLQKPSQWRWPSSKRLLVFMGVLLVLMLVFEGVFLAGETQPFLLRSAMQLQAQLRYPTDCASTVLLGPTGTDSHHLRSSGPSSVSSDSNESEESHNSPSANTSTEGFADTEHDHSSHENTGTESSPSPSTDSVTVDPISPIEAQVTEEPSDDGSYKCSSKTLDPKAMEYRSEDGFYSMLQSGLAKYPPPVFRGNATALCDIDATGKPRYWDYCLPVSGRKDVPYCHAKDRNDLLRPHSPSSRCFNSALHMLMVEVYEEMKHVDMHPAMLYGTLLGAVREGLTISFTEDADIGYNMMEDEERPRTLRAELAKKGYHMFHMGIWRVCIAPTHPLASNLYDPTMDLLDDAMEAPYVDLYEMKLENETMYHVAEASPNPLVSRDKIEPFSQVTLHGMKYDTVADPHYFLKREYGEDYMTPKPRTPKPTQAAVSTSASTAGSSA